MPKNLIIDGQTYSGVSALKATDAATGSLIVFPDTSDANATESDILSGKIAYVNGEKLNGTNTGTIANDLDGLIDGTITAFVMPSGKTAISQYRFYQFTSLTSANLGGVKTIGQYAFDGCTRVANLAMPKTITNVGAYGFRSIGSAASSSFEFSPMNPCAVSTYGFNSARVSKVKGKFTALDTYCFASCTSLADIDIESSNISDNAFHGDTAVTSFKAKTNGSVGSYSFFNLYNVANCDLSVDSVITSLGNYAFSRFGGNRPNPETNIITLDLRNSTFTSIPQYGFGGDSSSNMYKNRFMKLLFSKNISSINAYAFRYTDNCDFYFYKDTPPTLSVTTAWGNATSYNIFVPHNSVHTYRMSTNWTAQNAFIKGFAADNTFEVGVTLPTINEEGYGLTWYTDSQCTNLITTVTDSSAILYCVVGVDKLAYKVKNITALDCSIVVTDGEKIYTPGSDVLTNAVLTVTATPSIEGYIPFIFKVNGADFTSGSSVTMNEDLNVSAIYYDGVNIPINPVFAENTWEMIYQAFRAGTAAQFWIPGDTKPVTLTDGRTYTIRIADMKEGRYSLADGSGTSNGVLEFVELINLAGTTRIQLNYATKEGAWVGGGWLLSDMKNTTLDVTLWALLPDDMKAAMSEIKLTEYSYTGVSPRDSINKLFLPAETEMFSARNYSAEGIQSGCVKYDQFGYYSANNINPTRIKRDVGTTTAYHYWLRSPYSGGSNYFCVVNGGGSYSYSYANSSGGVAPCFAI